MVPLNLTYLHCLQHSLFEHLFNIFYFLKINDFLPIQIESLKSTSTEGQVVNALEKVANATKGPSGEDSLTDGELTSVSESLESVANLLDTTTGLVSTAVAEVGHVNVVCLKNA